MSRRGFPGTRIVSTVHLVVNRHTISCGRASTHPLQVVVGRIRPSAVRRTLTRRFVVRVVAFGYDCPEIGR